MNNGKYIRQQAEKFGWKKYYSLLRPVSMGTHPTRGMVDFINFDQRTEINGRMVWAEIYYSRELTEKELEDHEMIRG